MYKVALWGTGNGYNLFSSHHGHSMVEVVAITDSKWSGYYKSIDGIPVVPTEKIADVPFDYLIISVIDDCIYKEIVNEAMQLGIKREVILPLRIFKIPFFDFDEYIKIKESNVSIISDYCFGVYLYHKFGMKFTSPTILMYADNDNYLRFLKDIRGHLAEPMREVENCVETPYKDIFSYPRGRVGDSERLFNHDKTFETAAERWNKGVERFNYDNYIVTMTIRSEKAAYEFDKVEIKNKVGFFWKDLGLESVVYMPEWNDPAIRAKFGYDFARLVNHVAIEAGGIWRIDWMRLLLHKDNFKRIDYC